MTDIAGVDNEPFDPLPSPKETPPVQTDPRYDNIVTFLLSMIAATTLVGFGAVALKKRVRVSDGEDPSTNPPLSALGLDFFHYRPQDAADIHKIINNMADCGIFSLGFQALELQAAGNRITHLTSFAFIMAIFRNPETRQKMNKLFQVEWKWNRVVNGIASTTRTEDVPKLLPHVRRLALETGKDEAILLQYLKKDPPDVHSLTQYIFDCQKIN